MTSPSPGAAASIAVTVAIPSYERPEQLRRCLAGCARQTVMPLEVIVCLRTSDAASVELVDSLSGSLPFRTRVEMVIEPGHLPPLEAALSACSTPLLAVLDDDAVPRRDWLERTVETFVRNADAAAVGGPFVNHPVVPRSRRPLRYGSTWYGGLARLAGEAETTRLHRVPYVIGGNASYRVDALRRVGLDGNLRRGSSMNYEADLGLGMRELGVVYFNPEVIVDHYPARREGSQPRGLSLANVTEYTWNLHYVVSKHTAVRWRRAMFCAYMFLFGQGISPGLGRLPTASRRLGLSPGRLWHVVRSQARDGWRAGSAVRMQKRPTSPLRSAGTG